MRQSLGQSLGQSLRQSLLGLLTLVIILTLSLAGCGDEATTPEPPLPTAPSSPLATPIPKPTPLQPMIVTLGLWLPEELDPYGNGPGADRLANHLDDFSNAYPDIQVEVVIKQAHGRGGLLDFLRTAREAAPTVLPDLVILDAAELETAARSGLVQPLDTLLPTNLLADRFPFATGMGTVDDQTLGFIMGVDLQHAVYRPAQIPTPPISWTHQLSTPISFLFPAGGRDRKVNDATLIQYLAAGGKLMDDDGTPTLDPDVLTQVLGFYADGVRAAQPTPTPTPTVVPTTTPTAVPTVKPPREVTATLDLTASLSISSTSTPTTPQPTQPGVYLTISPTIVLSIVDTDQTWELFQKGIGDLAIVSTSRYWTTADDTLAPAPIPTENGYPFSIARRGWVIAIVTEDPTRQALAALLLNWLVAPDHNGAWTQEVGYLPSTRGTLRMWDVSSSDRTVLRHILDAAAAPPSDQALEQVGPAIQEALQAVLRGWSTPEEAAAAAVESLQ